MAQWTKDTVPKSPGRTGSKNKLTKALKEVMEELQQDPNYHEILVERIKSGQAPLIEKWMVERFVGKPKEQVDLTVNGPLFVLAKEPALTVEEEDEE